MAALVLLAVGWRTRRPPLAAVAVLAWLSAYEIVWNACDVLVHHSAAAKLAWLAVALAAWPLLAHRLGIRPHPVGLALCAAGFAVWLALGFDYNWLSEPKPLQVVPEALNVLTKTALGAAYLAGALAVPAPALGPARAPAQTR